MVANQTAGEAFERANEGHAGKGSGHSRLTELDALRGLAALAVFWSHAFGMLASRPPLLEAMQYTPCVCSMTASLRSCFSSS